MHPLQKVPTCDTRAPGLVEVTVKCGTAIFDTVRAAGGNSPAASHHVTQWNVMGVIVSEAFSASVRTAQCG